MPVGRLILLYTVHTYDKFRDEMPNLKRLASAGVWGQLESVTPPIMRTGVPTSRTCVLGEAWASSVTAWQRSP